MKIAIIGAGISGLTAAYALHRRHTVTVFEADNRVGGHTATHQTSVNGKTYAVDTGFIVYNDWTYPNFIRLLKQLGVKSRPTEMSFSVSCQQTGLEYSGNNLSTLFAQRRNLLSPYFLRLVKDILRFNQQAISDLESGKLAQDLSLGEYLVKGNYSDGFRQHYLVPMAAAIWSASSEAVLAFPLLFFVRFFKNHGLLSITNRPQWRTIVGGSNSYIAPLIAGFKDQVHLNTPVLGVRRQARNIVVCTERLGEQVFDHVIIATHSDQALKLLQDPDTHETNALASLPYQDNEVVLHTDTQVLPKLSKTWASWNYQLESFNQQRATLSYNMNILQGIDAEETFCVTLNNTAGINPEKILASFRYSHPVFSMAGIAGQAQIKQLNGNRNTWFCGAWCGNGFHEDGVSSALEVSSALGSRF